MSRGHERPRNSQRRLHLKNLRTILLAACAVSIVASSAFAMKWRGRPGSTNILDCRNGYYCTQNGEISWGGSWDHIWEPYLRYFGW